MGFYSSHIAKSYPAATRSHLDYIERKNKFKNLTDLLYIESGNLPGWAKDEEDYWGTVADYEIKREEDYKNGKRGKPSYAIRKYNFALPNEMTEEEMIQFTQDFLKENFTDYPYTFVIHKKDSAIHGIPNPHVHLIFADYQRSERSDTLDRETYFKPHGISKSGREYGGAARNREYRDLPPKKYRQTRKNLANRINAWYEERGIDKRVSEKSLKDQMQEAADRGDFLTAETLKREKPFRLPPEKFKKYKRVIQEKIRAGWRNVETLDDVPDPDVRNRILQEFEKQIKEEMAQAIKDERDKNGPSLLDRLRAVEYKISEIDMLQKFSPNRESVTGIMNEVHREKLEKEREELRLRIKGDEQTNYYFTTLYENQISDTFQNEHIQKLSEMSDREKIKEYAISAYTVQEMRKRMNTLIKQKEEIMLMKKLSPQYKTEVKKLLRKLDSKESLIEYRKKKGQDYEDLERNIDEIRVQIKKITDTALTPEERKEVQEEYRKIQKEIYELREVSSVYASRIRESGIDETFRKEHKAEIKEYMDNLERLNQNDIPREEISKENESKPEDRSRKELINDTILKRVETFNEIMKKESEKDYPSSLEMAREDVTTGAYVKLQKEKENLIEEQKATPESDYERQYELQEEINKIQVEIRNLEKGDKAHWEKKAKDMRKTWKEERKGNIQKLKRLRTFLLKDKNRKHINPNVQKLVNKTLKGSEEKIVSFEIRKTMNRLEDKRIQAINQKVEEKAKNFKEQFEKYRPHAAEYYIEQIINKETHGALAEIKKDIREAQKNRRFKLEANPKNDVSQEDQIIKTKKEAANRLIYEYLTPKMIIEAREKREEREKVFKANRKDLVHLRDDIRKQAKRKHLELKTQKLLKRLDEYTESTLSKERLLKNTVNERLNKFRKEVFKTIPRKEEWYIERIINEENHDILDQKNKEIRAAMNLIKKLKKDYPEKEKRINTITEELKQKIRKRDTFITSHTTTAIKEEAAKRRNEAIQNRDKNLAILESRYKDVLRETQRKQLPQTIRQKNREAMDKLRKVLDTAGNTHFEKSNSHSTGSLMRGAEESMNRLEGLLGPTIGRADIRTSDEGRD